MVIIGVCDGSHTQISWSEEPRISATHDSVVVSWPVDV